MALSWALAWRGRQHLVETRFAAAGPDAKRAAEMAERFGDMRLLAFALITVASVAGTTTDDDVDLLFDRAKAAAERARAFDLVLMSDMNRSHVYNYRGPVAKSYEMNRSILALTERPMPSSGPCQRLHWLLSRAVLARAECCSKPSLARSNLELGGRPPWPRRGALEGPEPDLFADAADAFDDVPDLFEAGFCRGTWIPGRDGVN